MSIQESSSNLLAFYKDWLEFAESDDPHDNNIFDRGCGLCSNCIFWMLEYDLLHSEIQDEMHHQFAEAGFDSDYPFGGERQYSFDVCHDAAIYNPMRLAWVKARIADAEGAE